MSIYVDADACPVKEEVNRVAKRYGQRVIYVANTQMRVPDSENAELVIVENQLDAADHWIAERVTSSDVVVTGDLPLAFRCVQKGAGVLSSNGRVFSEENIGHLLSTRDLMKELRDAGTITGGGPPPFQKQDRSRFLHALDQMIQKMGRKQP